VDCEDRIRRSYYDWGKDPEGVVDPPWDDATPEQRETVLARGYSLYDGWPVPQDDQITALDAYVSTGISSRVLVFDTIRLLVRAEAARPLLQQIPPDARLQEATPAQLSAAANLIDLFSAAPHIGVGKSTKVLHKKRPSFIPVIDSVVADFLWKNFPHFIAQGSSWKAKLALYRDILLRHAEPLSEIREGIQSSGLHLTTARILSHLIWLGWQDQVDEFGFGPPIRKVWGADNLGEAKRQASKTW
jgi:hypothetical protein